MCDREFQGLVLAWKDKESREDWRIGKLTQCIRHCLGIEDAHPLDYFGGNPAVKESIKKKNLVGKTPAENAKAAKAGETEAFKRQLIGRKSKKKT